MLQLVGIGMFIAGVIFGCVATEIKWRNNVKQAVRSTLIEEMKTMQRGLNDR